MKTRHIAVKNMDSKTWNMIAGTAKTLGLSVAEFIALLFNNYKGGKL